MKGTLNSMRIFLTTACILALSGNSFALDGPDAGRLLRESTPPPTLQAPQKPLIQKLQPKGKEKLSDGIKVLVTGFNITGATAFPVEQLQSLIASYLGKELNLAELGEVAEIITNYYRQHGYFLAEALIPAQTLKAGEPFRIHVLEGALEGVDLKTSPKETRVPRKLLEQYITRLPIGRPVEEVRLTSTAMLLNELPSISSRFVLEPGSTLGTTAAHLEITEGKAYSISIVNDNYGNYATGYYRTGIGLELYSAMRLGDQFNLHFQTSTSGATQSVRSGWWVPVNGYGTKVGVDYSYVRYELGRSFKSLDAHGDAHRFNLTLLQPLVRQSNLVVNATIVGEGLMFDDRIETAQQRSKRHIVGGQAGLNGVLVDSIGGTNSLFINYNGGDLRFDDALALANDQSANGMHTQGVYHKIGGSFSRVQRLIGNLSLYAGINGQWSNSNTDSAEKFSLGGPYAVRAYPVGEASADIGMVTTAELRYLQSLGSLGEVQLAGLFDYGYGQLDAKPIAGTSKDVRRIYGAGFSFSYFFNNWVNVKTSVAWRMGELPTSDKSIANMVSYFEGVVRF